MFDSWGEYFDFDKWRAAFDECGVKMEDYTREFAEDEILPWSFVDVGVTQSYLKEERKPRRTAAATVISAACRKIENRHSKTAAQNI